MGDTEYEKSWVVIPQKLLEELKWASGALLQANVRGDKLVIEKEKK